MVYLRKPDKMQEIEEPYMFKIIRRNMVRWKTRLNFGKESDTECFMPLSFGIRIVGRGSAA